MLIIASPTQSVSVTQRGRALLHTRRGSILRNLSMARNMIESSHVSMMLSLEWSVGTENQLIGASSLRATSMTQALSYVSSMASILLL